MMEMTKLIAATSRADSMEATLFLRPTLGMVNLKSLLMAPDYFVSQIHLRNIVYMAKQLLNGSPLTQEQAKPSWEQ